MSWARETPDGLVIEVRVVPRAARNEIAGFTGGALRIRLTAPPVEGKANQSLVKFLAARFGVRRGNVRILAGGTSRNKRVLIEGQRREPIARLVDAVTSRTGARRCGS